MVKPPCYDKLIAKKRGWAEEEDRKALAYMPKNGARDGSPVTRKSAKESSSGMKRCGKSCRVRWTNYLKPDVNHESFTSQEEELIIKLHAAVGSRWPIIAHQLPGRTENDIKNYWNTKLRKKLTQMGIDPVTHKPFSQILADYGSIGGLSRATGNSRYIGSIKKDLKKVASFTTSPKEEYDPPSLAYAFISNTQVSHTFSHNNYDNHDTSNNNQQTTSHSLDLLSQLQAISLVTEGSDTSNNFAAVEQIQAPFGSSPASASASASSLTYTAGQAIKSPETFSWHEFLLDEQVVKTAQIQESKYEVNDTGYSFSSMQSQLPLPGNGDLISHRIHGVSSSLTSTDTSTFLEAMLDQENDMFLNFPGLMEEPLY